MSQRIQLAGKVHHDDDVVVDDDDDDDDDDDVVDDVNNEKDADLSWKVKDEDT